MFVLINKELEGSSFKLFAPVQSAPWLIILLFKHAAAFSRL